MPSKASSKAPAVVRDLIDIHPLQRLPSPSRGASAFVHVAGLASFAASFKYLTDYPNPANEAWGWHFIYLTIIGLFLATATFAAGLAADLTLSRRIFLVKNALSFCSAPLELVISILYWSLRVVSSVFSIFAHVDSLQALDRIDKNLVLPEWAELSQWADLGFHAVPAIALTVDLLFLSPPWTMGAAPAFGISALLALGYWYWVEQCYARNGWYPYPLLDVLPTQYRIALFAGSALVMTLNASLLGYVYSRVNRREVQRMKHPQAKPGALKQ